MAVTVDAVSGTVRFNGVASGTNGTASHTVSASATVILLFVESGRGSTGTGDDSTIAVTVATLGGKAFTHLGSALKHSGADAEVLGFVDVYYMTATSLGSALPSGASTLSITETATGTAQLFGNCWSVSYLGSDGNAPTLVTPQNGKLVGSLTLTATLAAGDLIAGIACNGTAAPGVTTGTSDATATGGSTNNAADNTRVAHNTGTGSTTIVFSTNSGDWSAASGAKLVAAGGASFMPNPTKLQQPARMRAANW